MNKEIIKKMFLDWLQENVKEYYPLNNWDKSIVLEESWISCYWNEPCGKGLTSRMRVIPLDQHCIDVFGTEYCISEIKEKSYWGII